MHYKYGMAKGSSGIDVAREKELIARVQQYDDKLAMKELIGLYGGLMQKAITNSGILSSGLDPSTITNYAEMNLKKAIKSYNESVGTQPNTYIMSTLDGKMRNLRYEIGEETTHMSDENQRFNKYRLNAMEWLERTDGIEANNENAFNFTQNELKKGGKNMSKEKFLRTEALNRRDYSADRIVGGDTDAEAITIGEILSQENNVSGNDLFYEYQVKEEIKKILESPDFSRAERVFIRKWAGLDEVGVNRTLTIPQAALNAGISTSQAKAAIEKLKAKRKG